MTRLYQRRAVVTYTRIEDLEEAFKLLPEFRPGLVVGKLGLAHDLVVDGLRTTFRIEKALKKEANNALIGLTNLSATTRGSMQVKDAKVTLLAGYENEVTQIYSGDIRTIDHVRDGPNWNTRIASGDGQRSIQGDFVNESFRAGTTLGQVLRTVIEAMDVSPGNSLSVVATLTKPFSNGYALKDYAAKALHDLLKTTGLTASIQDGTLQLLKKGQIAKRLNIVLSPDTGLVGSPQFQTTDKLNPDAHLKPVVLKAKCLLQPAFYPGTSFTLKSAGINGEFLATKVTHSGDTAGQDWYTEVEAEVHNPNAVVHS